MASAKIFRINYKSDFILTLESDAGWMTPFCIKFWTGAPSQAYYVGWDGETYTHCSFDPSEPTKLQVQFDDHHLPIGDLKYQVAYHFTVADFPNDTEDEVINPENITTEIDGETYQVMLDFTGETAPEIQFALPAYANEAQRIANEQQRIAAETQRIANEETRIANEQTRINQEQTRQQNEQQRINQEQARVNEYATLKADAVAATGAANDAAALANQKAQLAADKAALAQDAANLANAKAQLAADKAALAASAAQLANDKAALAQQKAEYAQTQGGYAKDQGDYAKDKGDICAADHLIAVADHGIAVDDHTQAGNDHTRAESDHGIAVDDHTQAGNDHTRAESDHGIAVNDHTQAGTDHTRSESDHATASADHTQAGQDHTRAESDHTRAESDHAAVEVYVDSLGAFDISAYHATGGVLAKYADLTAALGTNGANIPDTIRKGGMSVKFVLTSDNKYVQFRYMGTEITGTPNPFLDTTNWIDEDEIKSSNAPFVDLNIEDDNHNALVSFAEGHIRTKNFDSSKNAITTQQKEKLNSIEEGAQVNDVNVSPLNDLSDFSVSDPNGNTLLLLRNGHIRTKNFDSANSLKKSIKILFIGNSVTQDHVGYLPYLFKQLYPNEISFTIGNFYKAGRTIKDYVIDFITGNDTGLYSHAENTEIWTQDSQKYLLEAVTSEKWDIISIQAYTHRADAEDLSYAPTLVEWLRNNALSSFELAYLMPQNFVNASEKKDTRDAAITIIKENPCSILFAPYFCMEEAQKYWQVSGVLSPTGDGTHLREGLPVMITGMHLMDVICKRFGILSKIINNDLMMTRAIWATLNIPGPNGLVDESMNTEENYTKAQYCAVQGTKQTEAWFIKAINEMIASYN